LKICLGVFDPGGLTPTASLDLVTAQSLLGGYGWNGRNNGRGRVDPTGLVLRPEERDGEFSTVQRNGQLHQNEVVRQLLVEVGRERFDHAVNALFVFEMIWLLASHGWVPPAPFSTKVGKDGYGGGKVEYCIDLGLDHDREHDKCV